MALSLHLAFDSQSSFRFHLQDKETFLNEWVSGMEYYYLNPILRMAIDCCPLFAPV